MIKSTPTYSRMLTVFLFRPFRASIYIGKKLCHELTSFDIPKAFWRSLNECNVIEKFLLIKQ